MIGDDVEIIVLEIKGGQVRLGINAPKNIPVHRGEIHAKVIQEN
jgi:carbon storage regulator